MNRTEMKEYKDRLLALRARMTGDVNQLRENSLKKSRTEANGDLSSMPIHMADIGSDNFEQEFTLSLMENEGAALEKIEASLERIDEGTYGTCEDCGQPIDPLRLEAKPAARYCMNCAAKH